MKAQEIIIQALHDNFSEFTEDQASAVIEALKLEGFVLMPKELSDEKADDKAMFAWGFNLKLFKFENRYMTAIQVEEFRLNWCRNKARSLQHEYRLLIEAQEQSHD